MKSDILYIVFIFCLGFPGLDCLFEIFRYIFYTLSTFLPLIFILSAKLLFFVKYRLCVEKLLTKYFFLNDFKKYSTAELMGTNAIRVLNRPDKTVFIFLLESRHLE